MGELTLHIKNMVCPRCIQAVKSSLEALNLPYHAVHLGEVFLNQELTTQQQQAFSEHIAQLGFELLENSTSQLIAKVKTIIIEQVHYSDQALKTNFSVLIARQLNHDYPSLSRLFSSVEGITIEKFIAQQRIEKVKELINYNEHSLTQIAASMNYSSVAHLSAQFKKETGMTPTQFKNQQTSTRKAIDSL